jgi:5-(carboxyamino)imidazole ribonucleotide synthase
VKIGVLGAGQLGRMLALAGYPLDFDFFFVDPAVEACAGPLGTHLCAAYDDEKALEQLCNECDVVTYEFENVPTAAAEFVSRRRPLHPGPQALTVGQDRLSEKTLFVELGIAVPPFRPVTTREELAAAVRDLGLPAMLKTRRLGYDGKGQALLRSAQDLDSAWSRLGGQPLILEGFVQFEREVSMLAVRSTTGQTAFYPIVENLHRDGILRVARPRKGDPLQGTAEVYARRVMERVGYVGVLAFEFFVKAGELLANEIAPRVHNSGHWTIEGAACSQFENHLRAIAGLPLGSTDLLHPCVMVNFIGSAPALADLAAIDGLHIHLYGKSPKPLRKVGHGTLVAREESKLDAGLTGLVAMCERSIKTVY